MGGSRSILTMLVRMVILRERGWLIRGLKGEWLVGFFKFLGKCSAFVAELWEVLEGLDVQNIWGSLQYT